MGGGHRLIYGGWVGAAPCSFLAFTKKSQGNPFLKILDFPNFFVEDDPFKKYKKKYFTPSQSFFFFNFQYGLWVGKIAHGLEG